MNASSYNGKSLGVAAGSEAPRVEIVPEAYAKLVTYVSSCDVELSGLGIVDFVDGALVVQDVFLLPQTASAATTDIEEKDVAEFLSGFVRSGGDPRRLRLHWHSHARSPVFWSGTDQNQQHSGFVQAEWSLYLVLNHAGEIRACLHVRGPISGQYDKLPVTLRLDPAFRSRIEAEVAEKVRVVSYVACYRKDLGDLAYQEVPTEGNGTYVVIDSDDPETEAPWADEDGWDNEAGDDDEAFPGGYVEEPDD